MDKFLEFAKAIVDFLLWVCWVIYLFFAFVFEKIVALLKGITLPIMPTATRVFQETWIVGTLLVIVLLYMIISSISAFILFRKDKILSKKNPDTPPNRNDEINERIRERTLLLRCFFGGAIGGYLSMIMFRHKTQKPKFNIGVSVMAIIQLLLYSSLIGYFVFWLCLA